MVKHTQTIRRLSPTNCLSALDRFVGLAVKAFIIFQEVMKLQSFGFHLSDGLPANLHNISPLIFLYVLANLSRKNLRQSVLTFFIVYYEGKKFRMISNVSIQVYSWNFWLILFCSTIKKDHCQFLIHEIK